MKTLGILIALFLEEFFSVEDVLIKFKFYLTILEIQVCMLLKFIHFGKNKIIINNLYH